MNQNTLNYLNDNKSKIEKLVASGRKQGWFPIAKGKCFVMTRCSNQVMDGKKKVCGGMTAITFRNAAGAEKSKCFRCHT
jgi:hypothetical protein